MENQEALLQQALQDDIDRLVGDPSELVPLRVFPQRRAFFQYLVLLNYQHGVRLMEPPRINKFPVDLHRLYIAVRRRGGFKQVIIDKAWKFLCSEANPQMTESSAAGYQLRLHYTSYLLCVECEETDQNLDELHAFIESLRKPPKKRAKTGAGDSEHPKKRAKVVKEKKPVMSSNSVIDQALAEMAQSFKSYRIKYKFSQKDVAASIRGSFQTDMSQTTISRFETCKLSARNMESVRPLLEEWVERVEEAHAAGKTYVEFLKESKAGGLDDVDEQPLTVDEVTDMQPADINLNLLST